MNDLASTLQALLKEFPSQASVAAQLLEQLVAGLKADHPLKPRGLSLVSALREQQPDAARAASQWLRELGPQRPPSHYALPGAPPPPRPR